MNKKGFVMNLMEIIPILLLIILSIFTIIYLISSALHFSSESFYAESSNFASNLVYGEGCFSYYDADLQRNYPGLIDLDKLQSNANQNLIDCMNTSLDNRKIGARIQFSNLNSQWSVGSSYSVMAQPEDRFFTLYFNKRFFEVWKLISKTRLPGPGGARYSQYFFLVNYVSGPDHEIKKGVLEVEVVMKNA